MIRIIDINKPVYIQKNDFEKWLNKMLSICNDSDILPVDITDFIKYFFDEDNDLTIKFSNEVIKKRRGFYSLDDVKKALREKLFIDDLINEALDRCETKEELESILIETINIIAQLNDCSSEEIREIILKQLKNMYMDTIVLSDYDYDMLTITFYPRAINEFCRDSSIKKEVYEIEFLERIFNLSHYFFAESPKKRFNDIFKRTDYTSDVVKYSLSIYYMYCYCDYYGMHLHTYTFNEYSPLTYYKSGADYIENFNHFYDIYEVSFTNLDNSLRILFEDASIALSLTFSRNDLEDPMKVYYDIKNYYTYLKNKSSSKMKKSSEIYSADYYELFKNSKCLSELTLEDYLKRIIRVFKKHFAIDEHVLRILPKEVIMKLIEKLLEIEEGNNASALKKFYDFLIIM